MLHLGGFHFEKEVIIRLNTVLGEHLASSSAATCSPLNGTVQCAARGDATISANATAAAIQHFERRCMQRIVDNISPIASPIVQLRSTFFAYSLPLVVAA